MAARKIVLFDIDGTLIEAKGLGPRIFLNTFEKVFDTGDDFSEVSFAGATDYDLLTKLVTSLGYDISDEVRSEFYKELASEVERTLAAGKEAFHPIPGVREILTKLSSEKDTILALQTGNIERTAWLKLKSAGLSEFFNLGGFGDQAAMRVRLVMQALQRVQDQYGPVAEGDQVFVIGDTPADMAAAKACNATAIGVATGKFTEKDLGKSADHVLSNYSDPAGFFGILS